MNRLILIGNGFDLAHGLKTSYKDFIFWYLDQCFDNAGIYNNGRAHEDQCLRVSVRDHHKLMQLAAMTGGKGLSRFLCDEGILKSYLEYDPDRKYMAKINIEDFESVSSILAHNITYKSLFFKRLMDTCLDCGWVDIEQEYFDALKRKSDSAGTSPTKDIRTINENFAFLKNKLEEYLIANEESKTEMIDELLQNFTSSFVFTDFDTVLDRESLIQNQLQDIVNQECKDTAYVLNFNYTNTFENYLNSIRASKRYLSIELNHIHGQLNNPANPVIFGFGDEHDHDYKQFEELRNNALFEHVKSYYYMQTSNYRNLIRFLNRGYFQVFVVGHSCGLSDRTMFKEVFDHENCKSVRVFHYTDDKGKTDFFDKIINLGRHFSDKGRMRKLIVDFNEADAIPQKMGGIV